ncbi:MAG: hypothetical protein ACPL06_01310 [Candidatus Anstonellales archaeon]
MFGRDVKKPTGPGTKPDSDGNIEFSKFKDVMSTKVEKIKDEITNKINKENMEKIAEWFCKEVDNDKIGKGNAYFDALIELLKPLLQSDEANQYIELISEVYGYFTNKMENKERGQMHWENMQKRFKDAGLPIEIE